MGRSPDTPRGEGAVAEWPDGPSDMLPGPSDAEPVRGRGPDSAAGDCDAPDTEKPDVPSGRLPGLSATDSAGGGPDTPRGDWGTGEPDLPSGRLSGLERDASGGVR